MTTFADGPAKGQNLSLQRAVKFLRVTEEGGKFDALDQPEDTPRPTEKLYAYRMARYDGMCHINRGGGRGGFYALALYQMVEPQPFDTIMRDNQTWAEWCQQNDFKV